MDSVTQGIGCNRSHSAGFPTKRANPEARSRAVRVVNIVHPCRVKSFRKAMFTVMDDLVTDSRIIDDINLIVKPRKSSVQVCFLEGESRKWPWCLGSADDVLVDMKILIKLELLLSYPFLKRSIIRVSLSPPIWNKECFTQKSPHDYSLNKQIYNRLIKSCWVHPVLILALFGSGKLHQFRRLFLR